MLDKQSPVGALLHSTLYAKLMKLRPSQHVILAQSVGYPARKH